MNIRSRLAGLFTLNGLVWLPLLIAMAGILACAAAGFLALAPLWGNAAAALAAGLALLAFAGLVALLLRRSLSTPQASEPASAGNQPDDSAATQALRPLLGDETTEWARAHKHELTLGAVAAGAALAASPRLRHALGRAVMPMVMRGAVRALSSLNDGADRR